MAVTLCHVVTSFGIALVQREIERHVKTACSMNVQENMQHATDAGDEDAPLTRLTSPKMLLK